MSRQNQRYAARLRKLDVLLGQTPDDVYDHSEFIVSDNPASCATIGCAMGHAVVNRSKFPGLDVRYNGPGLDAGETYTFGLINGEPAANRGDPFWMPVREGMKSWANHYFGPGTFDRIFDTDPYEYLEDEDSGRSDPAEVKAAVRKNLRMVAGEFEEA